MLLWVDAHAIILFFMWGNGKNGKPRSTEDEKNMIPLSLSLSESKSLQKKMYSLPMLILVK